MRRIFLIDCPGVVYDTGDTETDIVLKGVVRVENLPTPADYIPRVMEKVRPLYLQRTYEIASWTDPIDFLTKLAIRSGKLLRGGEPDVDTVAKMVLYDWQRGKVPWFSPPPFREEEEQAGDVKPESGVKEEIKEERDGTTRKNPIDVEKAKVVQSFAHLLAKVKEETAEKEEAEDEEGEENDSDVGEGNEEEEEDEEEDAIITKETKKARKEAELEEMIRGLQVKQVFKNMRVKSDFWTQEDQAAPEELKDLEKEIAAEEDEALDWDQVLGSVVGEEEVPFDSDEDEDEVSEDDDEDDEEVSVEDEEVSEKSKKSKKQQVEEEDEEEVKEEDDDEDVVVVQERKRAREDSVTPKGGPRAKARKVEPVQQSRPKQKRKRHDDDESEKTPVKEARMTTNKKKIGTHFYDTHNVKNKNRSRSKNPSAPGGGGGKSPSGGKGKSPKGKGRK
jgi:nuclear GTP-binding protein